MIQESNLPEQVLANIPRKSNRDFYEVRSNEKFNLMIVDLGWWNIGYYTA